MPLIHQWNWEQLRLRPELCIKVFRGPFQSSAKKKKHENMSKNCVQVGLTCGKMSQQLPKEMWQTLISASLLTARSYTDGLRTTFSAAANCLSALPQICCMALIQFKSKVIIDAYDDEMRLREHWLSGKDLSNSWLSGWEIQMWVVYKPAAWSYSGYVKVKLIPFLQKFVFTGVDRSADMLVHCSSTPSF